MKFTLTIDLGNDAMQTSDDIGKALADISKTMRGDHTKVLHIEGQGAKIRDVNGNTVGEWRVK